MNFDQIGCLLDGLSPAGGGSTDAGYALPDGTLGVLTRIIGTAGVRNVFEFGSGRSTKAFLAAGCRVTAVEDSREWLDRTVTELSPEELSRLHAVCQGLEIVFYQGAPFRSWTLDEETLGRLAFPPFREHALSVSLRHCRGGLIVVDDARIPTVRRFCLRLAGGEAHRECGIDHGLFFLIREGECGGPRRGLWETLKAWRRFFMGWKRGIDSSP